jgi:hypothetical protein
MVVAKQQGTIIPTVTPQSLNDGLKVAFAAAGYGGTPYAEFDESGSKNLVYQIVNDISKAFGTIYLHVVISNDCAVSQQLHTSFDLQTNTGTNTRSPNFSNNFAEDDQVNWTALNNGAEFKWVMLYQNSRVVCLGTMRPDGMPDFWDEDIAPYVLVNDTSNSPIERFRMAEITPYSGEIIQTNLYMGVPNSRNPFDQQVDIVSRLILSPDSGEGIFGMTSGMIAQATDQDLSVGDTILLADGKEYFVILKPNYNPVVTVRIA